MIALLPTALKVLRSQWHLLIIGGLALSLFITRGTLASVRAKHALAEQTRIAEAAKQQAQWLQRLADAQSSYADELANMQPIIIRSKDTVTKYAQTDAGKLPCLAVDRVRGIDMLDADLRSKAATTATSESARAVPDTANAAPNER